MRLCKKIVTAFYEKVIDRLFILPLRISFFFRREVGHDYNMDFMAKLRLILKFRHTLRRIDTLSTWLEHLEMTAAILQIPPTVQGDIIECGCYKGGSTINLSLVCSIVGRKLIVCDSFQGLPNPRENERIRYSVHNNQYDYYEGGKFYAALDEVQNNVKKFGCIEVCEFVVGYFDKTLPKLDKKYAMAFLDIGLIQSLEPCLRAIWPSLHQGCKIFVHEAMDLGFVSLFFDKEWWHSNLHTDPPGFIGAGTGLPLEIRKGSELGYAIKLAGDESDFSLTIGDQNQNIEFTTTPPLLC